MYDLRAEYPCEQSAAGFRARPKLAFLFLFNYNFTALYR
jgi:hypothetical protein